MQVKRQKITMPIPYPMLPDVVLRHDVNSFKQATHTKPRHVLNAEHREMNRCHESQHLQEAHGLRERQGGNKHF